MPQKLLISFGVAALIVLGAMLFFLLRNQGNDLDDGDPGATNVVTPVEDPSVSDPTLPLTNKKPRVVKIPPRAKQSTSDDEGVLEGVVLDAENGKPVVQAQVSLMYDLPRASGERQLWLASVYTSPAGAFRFENLRNASYRVQAAREGYLDDISGGLLPGQRIELRMNRDAGITCVLELDTDTGPEPLAGYPVYLEILEDSWQLEVESNAAGLFLVTGLTHERFERARKRGMVEIIVPGYADPFLLETRSDRRDEVPYTVLVERGLTVFGRVVEANSGSAIVGATVVSDYGHLVETDQNGQYQLSGVEDGISAYAPGYSLVTKEVDDFTDDIDSEEPIEINISLGDGVTLYGRVTNELGQPLADIRIGVAPDALDLDVDEERMEVRLLEELSTLSDASGRYRLSGLPVEALDLPGSFELEIRPPNSEGGVIEDVDVEVEAGEVEYNIVVDLVAAVHGKVTAADGSPLAGAKIFAESADAELFQATATDSRGEFEFEHLVPGDYKLAVEKGGRPLHVETVSVPDDAIDLRIKPAANISGSVIFETDNQPLPEMTVQLVFLRGTLLLALSEETDDSGEFKFSDVPSGEFYLEIKPPPPILPFNAFKSFHRVPVDMSDGDWEGEIRVPGFAAGEVLFRFLLREKDGEIRPIEDPVEIQVAYYRRDRFRVGSPTGNRQGFRIGQAYDAFQRKLRQGQYNLRFVLNLGGKKLTQNKSFTLGEGDFVEEEVVFTE